MSRGKKLPFTNFSHLEDKNEKQKAILADIELVSMLHILLQDGVVLDMANIHKTFKHIRKTNDIEKADVDRRTTEKNYRIILVTFSL